MCDGIDVITNIIVVIILHYIHVSNNHTLPLKFTKCYMSIKLNKFNKIRSYLMFRVLATFFSSTMSSFFASNCSSLNILLDSIEVSKIIENFENIHKTKHEHGHWACPYSIFNKCASNFYLNTFQDKIILMCSHFLCCLLFNHLLIHSINFLTPICTK